MQYKKTFMFVKKDLLLGGIETFVIRTIRWLKRNNYRIVYLFPSGSMIADGFKKDILNGNVEIIEVDFDNKNWLENLKIDFSENEQVIAYAFNLYYFAFLEVIKKKYKNIKINDFFWVPHFKEKGVFIEEFAPKPLRFVLRRYIGIMIRRMERNNNIIYVNQSHLDALTQTYNYKVENLENKLMLPFIDIKPYNESLALKRSERKTFNIITVGRFVFPHKAYLLGLIRTYGVLKAKYRALELTIIGHGPDENRVIEEINKLSSEARKDVKYVGKVEYDELNEYFFKANINIGVAGTIIDGAATGLISIPVRHYTEACEGYGFLPESRMSTVSSELGIPIEKYIEQVINMDGNKYLELSRKAYDTYLGQSADYVLGKAFKNENTDYRETLPESFLCLIQLAFRSAKFFRKIITRIKI